MRGEKVRPSRAPAGIISYQQYLLSYLTNLSSYLLPPTLLHKTKQWPRYTRNMAR